MTPSYWKRALVKSEPHEGKLGIGFLVFLVPGVFLTIFNASTDQCVLVTGLIFLAASFLCVGHYFVKWWFNKSSATATYISRFREWYGAVIFTVWYAISGLVLILSLIEVLKKCIL